MRLLDRGDGERVEQGREQRALSRPFPAEPVEQLQGDEEHEHDRERVEQSGETTPDDVQRPVACVAEAGGDELRREQRKCPVDVRLALRRVVGVELRRLHPEVVDGAGPVDVVGDRADETIVGMKMLAVVPAGPDEAQGRSEHESSDHEADGDMLPGEFRRQPTLNGLGHYRADAGRALRHVTKIRRSA